MLKSLLEIFDYFNAVSNKKEEDKKKEEEEKKKKLEEQKRQEEEIRKTLEDLKKFSQLNDEEKRKIEEKMRDKIRKNRNVNTEEIINQLSEYKITDLNKLNKETKDCRICLERFQKNDTAMYLPCFHFFHKKCIENWLEKELYCLLFKIDIKSNL